MPAFKLHCSPFKRAVKWLCFALAIRGAGGKQSCLGMMCVEMHNINSVWMKALLPCTPNQNQRWQKKTNMRPRDINSQLRNCRMGFEKLLCTFRIVRQLWRMKEALTGLCQVLEPMGRLAAREWGQWCWWAKADPLCTLLRAGIGGLTVLGGKLPKSCLWNCF